VAVNVPDQSRHSPACGITTGGPLPGRPVVITRTDLVERLGQDTQRQLIEAGELRVERTPADPRLGHDVPDGDGPESAPQRRVTPSFPERSHRVGLMSTFPAIGHLALTVGDLDASTAWYNRVFETEPAFAMSFDDFDRRVYLLPGGQALGITRHKSGSPGRFDPTVTGLDHVGFNCASLAELEAWAARLTELGIDNSGVRETDYGTIVSFGDPDGNAFDFFVSARATSD